jgi:hypothetical protein
MNQYYSREKIIDELYAEIAEIIEPGDLVFYITEYPHKSLRDEIRDDDWRSSIRTRLMPWFRPWFGLDRDDLDAWHVGIYCSKKKRKNHSRINLWIIHSTFKKGVHFEHLTPKQFSNNYDLKLRSRIEIVQFEGIKDDQRERIIRFAHSKVGSAFDHSYSVNVILSYMFGLPSIWRNQNQFACQQLAICSYGAAGIRFEHPYRTFPKFNIGRMLGHPFGHTNNGVNPKYPYLMDHHIYRDSRFILKAVVFQDQKTNEYRIEKENLRKWSWNEEKRDRYIERKLIASGQ